jgi:hypothetical protein
VGAEGLYVGGREGMGSDGDMVGRVGYCVGCSVGVDGCDVGCCVGSLPA